MTSSRIALRWPVINSLAVPELENFSHCVFFPVDRSIQKFNHRRFVFQINIGSTPWPALQNIFLFQNPYGFAYRVAGHREDRCQFSFRRELITMFQPPFVDQCRYLDDDLLMKFGFGNRRQGVRQAFDRLFNHRMPLDHFKR